MELVVRTFETSLGPVPLTGWFGGPMSVLAITGAFAGVGDMGRLPHMVAPRFGGLVAHLPGNHSPRLRETSIPAFAQAFDEVVDQLGPTVVLGSSVGALVGFAMRSANLKALVAIDPPLATAKLWPLLPRFRQALATDAWFVEPVLGVYTDRVEERRYVDLLEGIRAPVHAIVGDEPLFPERPLRSTPSLVDEPERAILAAHPLVTLTVADGAGHNIPVQAAPHLRRVLRDACLAAAAGLD